MVSWWSRLGVLALLGWPTGCGARTAPDPGEADPGASMPSVCDARDDRWSVIPSGTHNDLRGIWGSGPRDGWIVGARDGRRDARVGPGGARAWFGGGGRERARGDHGAPGGNAEPGRVEGEGGCRGGAGGAIGRQAGGGGGRRAVWVVGDGGGVVHW